MDSNWVNFSYILFGLGIVDILDALRVICARKSYGDKYIINMLNELCSLLQEESQENIQRIINVLHDVLIKECDECDDIESQLNNNEIVNNRLNIDNLNAEFQSSNNVVQDC